jgi:hypothetical protein
MLTKNVCYIYFAASISYSIICSVKCNANQTNFCDQNYIDSVIYDGLTYRIIRNNSLAEYDDKKGKVMEFREIGKDLSEFCTNKFFKFLLRLAIIFQPLKNLII